MYRVKRARHIYFGIEKEPVLDAGNILSGRLSVGFTNQLTAASILTGTRWPVTLKEVSLFLGVSTDDWTAVDDIISEFKVTNCQIDNLLMAGLLVSNLTEEPYRSLYEHNELLSDSAWYEHAANYHFLGKWRDVNVIEEQRKIADSYPEGVTEARIKKYGLPPPAFHEFHSNSNKTVLPEPDMTSPLIGLLMKRRTCRSFDIRVPLSCKYLSQILYYTFGCHGYSEMAGGIRILKKTSPSGGASHGVEVYPLIINVEGLITGLYHYDVRRHMLVEIQLMNQDEAIQAAQHYTAGQEYFSNVQVLFLLTARFYRTYWKYRQHSKAYRVILMDAAHLSQTLFLLASELGLGAFITAAINESNIEEAIGINGIEEGAIAVCGCGYDSNTRRDDLDPDWKPYKPYT